MIWRKTRVPAAMVVLAALIVAGCSTGDGVSPGITPTTDPSVTIPSTTSGATDSSTTAAPSTSIASTTTTEPPRDCTPVAGDPGRIDTDGVAEASVAVSVSTFPCADEVTLSGVTDAAGGAAHAMAVGGPLLIVTGELIDPAIVEEIQRLEPGTITTIGLEATDLTAISDLTPEQMTNAPEPIDDGTDVVVDSPARVWLVDDSTTLASAVMSAAAATGDTVLVVGGDDLRAMTPEQIDAVRLAGDAPAATVGPITDNADWQLDVIRSGQEVPGGGLLVFPDRRLIALYGHPGVPVLGVLGEQSPQEGIERLRPILEEYSADGIPAVPTFEIIATIADATAGADGDYSAEITVEALIPWIEVARDNGAYVILDLQPGRTDFLTQAKRYEELLREPHVGLALDPEWRLKPDQVHLRQIGSVEAAEINTVVEWLAGIVREEALPQKVLVLHQFRVDMIHDRETITIPPELAIVDHVDGQGALDLKYGTWGVLSTQPGSENLWWGWKNFYDEDPQLATPQQVLDLEPTVFMVSFQ